MGSLSSGAPLATAAAGGPPEHATLSDALRSSAALSDRGITYVRAGGSSTCTSSYADILAAAQHVLGGLQKLGMAKGDVCVMQISELPAHIHAIWGCIIGGVAPVNISVPRAYDIGSPVVQKLLGVLEDLEAKQQVSFIHRRPGELFIDTPFFTIAVYVAIVLNAVQLLSVADVGSVDSHSEVVHVVRSAHARSEVSEGSAV